MKSLSLRKAYIWVLAGMLILTAGCSAQTEPTTSAPVVMQDILQQKLSLNCEPGKEWWRSAGTPKRGGVMVEALLFGPASPILLNITNGGYGPRQVYSRFLQNNACYYEDNVMAPDAVKSWSTSPDGRTWTLKVRDDLKWHNLPPVNGRKLTSADLAWTIDLMLKEGATRTIWAKVKSHREPDPQTIILELNDPDPDFLVSTLGERYSIVLPREVYDQYGDFKTVAVGSGPFMMKSHQPGISLDRVKNPDWPEKGADGLPLPYLDGIKGVYFSDTSAEIAAARAGQLDRTGLQTFLKTDADAFRKDFPNFRYHESITSCPWGGFINPTRKPFDDIRVRRAIALALDQEEMVQGALAGGAIPTGYLPVALTQYAWPPAKVKEKFAPNLEESKRLLAEAGYGPNNPLRFKLHAGQTGGDSGRVEVAQQQLRRVGIETEIELMPENSSTYLANLSMAQGKYDSMWGTHSPCTFEPSRWMGTLYLTGSSRNVLGISDPKLDAMAKAQMSELDPAKRKVLLDQMQDYVYDLRPFFPTDSRMYFRFEHCRLKNMHGMDWHDFLTGAKEAWLDPTSC